jgi:hypothetical protein
MIGRILVLGLAAAVYPQLLAVVVVILTRKNPLSLLWVCYAGCLLVSVGTSAAVLLIFHGHGSIAGTSSSRPGPAAYLALGCVALMLAALLATSRASGVLPGRPECNQSEAEQASSNRSTRAGQLKARANAALDRGSIAVAGLVGALLAIPGPFDLLALGRLARSSYTLTAALAIMVGFALIKFIAIELPIAAYAIAPEHTSSRVARLSKWLQGNNRAALAVVVGLVGVLLLARGIAALP